MLKKNEVVREDAATHNSPPEQPETPKTTIIGIHAAGAELHDACLHIVEVANQIERIPSLTERMGPALKLQLMTTRMCAQQALHLAKVHS